MTPLPRFASWDAPVNGHLEEQCRNRQGNVLRGHRESIGERFVRDREALKRPLPAPFDACGKQGTRVNSLSLVRYRTNDYSVPVAYGHQRSLDPWLCPRGGYRLRRRDHCPTPPFLRPGRYGLRSDPLPGFAGASKIGALDQAAPLAGWELPDAFPTLRRLLEAIAWAGRQAGIRPGPSPLRRDLRSRGASRRGRRTRWAPGCDRLSDAVKHLVPCRIERRARPNSTWIIPSGQRGDHRPPLQNVYEPCLLGGGASNDRYAASRCCAAPQDP